MYTRLWTVFLKNCPTGHNRLYFPKDSTFNDDSPILMVLKVRRQHL